MAVSVISKLDFQVFTGLFVILGMIENFFITQEEKTRLYKQVEMGLLYQKYGYSQHCQEDATCKYHCINFALSNPKIQSLRLPCLTKHTAACSQCDNIIHTLAEINYHISNVINNEVRQELEYDLYNSTESIIEWFHHIIRVVCQDNEKARIINNLTTDSAFTVFDWGQKIIPQRCRESQDKYFGKKVYLY